MIKRSSIPIGLICCFILSSCSQEVQSPPTGRTNNAIVVSEEIDIQTEHPYDNNTDQSWTVEAPKEATSVIIRFDQFETERNYDFVEIYDADGALVERLSGVHTDESVTVSGNVARIRFTSDYSVVHYGFAISQYSYTTEDDMSDDPSLMPVGSCDSLRDYVAEMTTDMLLERPMIRLFDIGGGRAELAAKAAPSDFTTTNVQEEGVDEADIVETDGSYVYVLHNNNLIIVDSWPAEETEEISRIDLGDYTYGMFLYGDRIIAFSSLWNQDYFRWGATRVSVVDVTDRENPVVTYQVDVEGNYIDARSIEGQVYLVTQSSFWNQYRSDYQDLCDEVMCHSWYEADTEDQEAARAALRETLLPLVRARLDDVSDDELLPHFVEDGTTRAALECTDIHRPWKPVQAGIVMFSAIDMTSDSPVLHSSAVIGNGYTIYASLNNIYLAQTSRFWFWWQPQTEQDLTTVIHKLSFPADGSAPEYQATGKVAGFNSDQFSMSEHNGMLRVATSEEWWGREGNGNNVFVLEQSGRYLREIGSIRGMSPDQRIFGVRFMGDMGYVITFEQIDPLHVIDLSDPTAPVQLGELEIPGFSTYLHPFAEGLLIGIGYDEDRGIQLSLFDVRDPSTPTRIHQTVVETGGWSEALNEHHAFTYHPERQLLAIPLNNYSRDNYFSGTVVYRVSEEDGFTEVGRVDHVDIARRVNCNEWYTDDNSSCFDEDRRWWVSMRRNVFIEDSIYSISNVGMSIDNLYAPEEHYASLAWQLGPWSVSNRTRYDITDFNKTSSSVEFIQDPPCTNPVVRFDLDIAHSYVGDLFITLSDPMGVKTVVRSFEGGDDDFLYLWNESVDGPLGHFGLSGTWTLDIWDFGRRDEGTLNSWTLRVQCDGVRL